MREYFEFRIPEERAANFLKDDDGVVLGGSVRKLELESTDPRMMLVEAAEKRLRREGKYFFASWRSRRKYSETEVANAKLLRLLIRKTFEPAGEMCGTVYSESSSCRCCGAGAVQSGPLVLDCRRIPRNRHFAITIAGEIIVSQLVAAVFEEHDVTGVELRPIKDHALATRNTTNWFQLIASESSATVVSPTRVGIDPFDADLRGEYRCSEGDLLGLAVLSEVHLQLDSKALVDVVASRQFVGVRKGVLRPQRLLFISQRVRNLLIEYHLSGCEFELAYV